MSGYTRGRALPAAPSRGRLRGRARARLAARVFGSLGAAAGTPSVRSLLLEINAVRARQGLSPLRLSRQLTAAADSHTRDMARRGLLPACLLRRHAVLEARQALLSRRRLPDLDRRREPAVGIRRHRCAARREALARQPRPPGEHPQPHLARDRHRVTSLRLAPGRLPGPQRRHHHHRLCGSSPLSNRGKPGFPPAPPFKPQTRFPRCGYAGMNPASPMLLPAEASLTRRSHSAGRALLEPVGDQGQPVSRRVSVIGTWRSTFGSMRSKISSRLSPVMVRPWLRRPITAWSGRAPGARSSATATASSTVPHG